MDVQSRAEGKIEYTITHSNAIAVYLYDPGGNRAEGYWDTGLKACQGWTCPALVERH
jgi:catechol-2,3-dioxygenase